MSAPTTTARTTPTGYQLPDGYNTTIACALKPAFQIWEQTVKPGSIESGNAIDNTSMFNGAAGGPKVRTKRAPALHEHGVISGTGFYDPDAWTDGESIINVETSFTVHYSTGDKRDFYGYYSKLDFKDCKQGEIPTVDYEITVTDWDPVAGIPVAPVYTAAAGT